MKSPSVRLAILVLTPGFLFAGINWSGYDLHDPEQFVQGEINIRFEAGVDLDEMALSLTEMGVRETGRVERLNILQLRLNEETDVLEEISYYESRPDVLFAAPVVIVHAYWTPNDPLFGYQWHFNSTHINMEAAWDIEQGGSSGVTVAIVDTGVAYEDYPIPAGEQSEVLSDDGNYHVATDLAGTNFVAGYDFVNNDDHPNDEHGHGTHVTGTVAQTTNNGEGVAGMAFGCSLMPVRVLDQEGSGYDTQIANGITWAADNGADVINLSLGGPNPTPATESAVNYANSNGVVVCAATGNGNQWYPGEIGYPARYDACIAVGATDYNDNRSYYSQWGPGIDISAPGGNTSADENNDGMWDGVYQCTYESTNDEAYGGTQLATVDRFSYHAWQGTSMASPHVAGLAALVISHGVTTVDSVKDAIYTTARDLGAAGYDETYGYGMIDPVAALNYGGGSTPEPPVADFSGTPLSGTPPLDVTFTDLSTNSPTTWAWTFGDGGTSDQQNPSHTYSAEGTYTVELTVTNADGSDTETKTDYITVSTTPPPLAAEFTGNPLSGDAPLAVTFTDQSTGNPTTWAWTFGDGGTSTQQTPTYTYNTPGTYDVALTVSDGTDTDTETKTGYITVTDPGGGPNPPVAAFTASPTEAYVPLTHMLTVTFTDQSTNTPTSWVWDFGDGSTTSTEQNPTHIYTSAGDFTVSLSATNADGSDNASDTIHLYVAPSDFFTQAASVASLTQDEIEISYGSPVASDVVLSVYNINGQLVKHLVAEEIPMGEHSILWNLRDWQGAKVVPGVYFVRLKAPQGHAVTKITITR